MRTALGLSTSACDERHPLRAALRLASAPALWSVAALALTCVPRAAHAQDAATAAANESVVTPPASQHQYIQYGVGLAAEVVGSPGPICPNVTNCILGSGGGLDVRVGWRALDKFYLGGAYEMSKQDPNQLYRLGILQQLRAEGRRYFPTGKEVSPFVLVGAGATAYGNEWRVDTWGASITLGGGLEVELGGAAVNLSLAYRPMYFKGWADSSGIPHDSGIAHFFSLEASIEAKDQL